MSNPFLQLQVSRGLTIWGVIGFQVVSWLSYNIKYWIKSALRVAEVQSWANKLLQVQISMLVTT